ncbi:hypothetical protein BDR06DRAFT_686742 [Suillus hirtellus]|nr:hypothetical protein BDR06DRAFT_686742 [Suillus hirtellus]
MEVTRCPWCTYLFTLACLCASSLSLMALLSPSTIAIISRAERFSTVLPLLLLLTVNTVWIPAFMCCFYVSAAGLTAFFPKPICYMRLTAGEAALRARQRIGSDGVRIRMWI